MVLGMRAVCCAPLAEVESERHWQQSCDWHKGCQKVWPTAWQDWRMQPGQIPRAGFPLASQQRLYSSVHPVCGAQAFSLCLSMYAIARIKSKAWRTLHPRHADIRGAQALLTKAQPQHPRPIALPGQNTIHCPRASRQRSMPHAPAACCGSGLPTAPTLLTKNSSGNTRTGSQHPPAHARELSSWI